MLNKVFLIGRMTRDPEVRYTSSGTAVTDIGVAVNRVYTLEGEKKQEVTFVDVQIWGPQAESDFLRKGQQVIVEGRLRLDTWDDKQTGQKRSRLRVVAERIQASVTASPAASSPPKAQRPAPATEHKFDEGPF
jgi:single-strand DNA-binding protein